MRFQASALQIAQHFQSLVLQGFVQSIERFRSIYACESEQLDPDTIGLDGPFLGNVSDLPPLPDFRVMSDGQLTGKGKELFERRHIHAAIVGLSGTAQSHDALENNQATEGKGVLGGNRTLLLMEGRIAAHIGSGFQEQGFFGKDQ